jgi:signal transduction histidine kinase
VLRSFLPLARDAGVTIDVRLDDTVEAWIDRGALRQVLLNLLDNAIKYGPRGQQVTVSLTRAGHVARMAVEDEGPGVGETDRERIWQPFVRGSSDAAESGGQAGNGIGLAVVRDLTVHLGGRAWVERARGTGARFIVELPATAADPIEARRLDAVDAVGASTWHGDGSRAS